jgi:hypothetical protein
MPRVKMALVHHLDLHCLELSGEFLLDTCPSIRAGFT